MDTDEDSLVLTGNADPHVATLGELNPVTEKIIGCAYTVSNGLGAGFLEKVYENALAHEMRKGGLKVTQQQSFRVLYDNVEVGYYEADIVVEGKVLVELKAVRSLDEVHRAQCMNYLRASGLRICLLINFATPRIQIKRIAR
ncbi:MAG: GxxExxY protein [Acidobacteriota bacterium]|nr:MAG: GxxExxY protein [Acidobacteriota bacterium]